MPYYRWLLTAPRPRPHYPKELKSLGDHLKTRRLDLGVTQWAIAERLGVNPDSVRNWEAGRTSIEVRYYPTLIGLLGYNPLPFANTSGQLVRRERMTRGWSRRKLALIAQVDEATVRRIEADTKGTARKCWNSVKTALNLS